MSCYKICRKSVVIIPIPNVTAKPFTGPDPKANKIIVANKVVMFASKTVIFALLYPISKAWIIDFQFEVPL